MGMAGRKSEYKELQIVSYYAELAPKAFAFVTECFEKGNQADKKWAMEWLRGGLIKMIPQIQKIGGDEDNQIPIPITLLNGATQNGLRGDDSTPQNPPAS